MGLQVAPAALGPLLALAWLGGTAWQLQQAALWRALPLLALAAMGCQFAEVTTDTEADADAIAAAVASPSDGMTQEAMDVGGYLFGATGGSATMMSQASHVFPARHARFFSGDLASFVWDEATKTHADYAEFREQMTREAVAAIEGAQIAGATDILVKDAHSSGRNLITSMLPENVRLVRSWAGHPLCMVQELDESFDAVMMIGYHRPWYMLPLAATRAKAMVGRKPPNQPLPMWYGRLIEV